MKSVKYALPLPAVVAMAAPIRAGAAGEVMKHLNVGGWMLMVHVRSIPKQYRATAKATHHISIMATNEKGRPAATPHVTAVQITHTPLTTLIPPHAHHTTLTSQTINSSNMRLMASRAT